MSTNRFSGPFLFAFVPATALRHTERSGGFAIRSGGLQIGPRDAASALSPSRMLLRDRITPLN